MQERIEGRLQDEPPLLHFWPSGAALILSGACVGWLLGLSASPVLAGVVTAIMASLAGIVATASGVSALRESGPDRESPDSPPPPHLHRLRFSTVPMALLLFGVAAGATVGVVVRSRNSLGVGEPGQRERLGVLFTDERAAVTACGELRRATLAERQRLLSLLDIDSGLRAFLTDLDEATTAKLVEKICAHR